MLEKNKMNHVVIWIVAAMATSHALADVKLPSLISDNMVLQQGVKAPIWGWAEPGEKITVTIGQQKIETTPDANGRWQVRLKPMKPGQTLDMTVAGKNKLVVKNILVGEVWLASGQSNMNMRMSGVTNAATEIANANYPQIRQFVVQLAEGAEKPQQDAPGRWIVCDPKGVLLYSGVAYFFARELHQTLKVSIGLINSSRNGSLVEAWTSMPALEKLPEARPLLERYENALPSYLQVYAEYKKALADRELAMRNAKTDEEKRKLVYPQYPYGPGRWDAPSGLYNSMIAPLIPYAIKGVIWYQGESNADRAYLYRSLFPAMIADWRKSWNEGEFPFYFVQIANFMGRIDVPAESDWAELREAQAMALRIPNTGMAVAIDVGDPGSIHPTNKQAVGKRLALIALARTYGKDLVYSGPMLDSMKVQGDKARLTFKHVGGGLITANNEPLKGFAIAGEDKKFVWAQTRIEKNSVVVWSDQVAKPVAVRYAWAANPDCNLYNQAGLPASPFRTDDWPGITRDKH